MKMNPPQNCGFSLVEVALALGIAAFCLISIFALLPVGINSNQSSSEQTVAASLVRAIVTDLRATPTTSGASLVYGIPSISAPPLTHTLFLKQDGSISGTVDTAANPALTPRYRAYLEFKAPATATDKSAIAVRILITWPALADRAVGVPTQYAGSYETLTSLYRN